MWARVATGLSRIWIGRTEVGMQSKWLNRIGLAALFVGVVGSSGMTMGCASERDPINRVQLNALPKSFFVGAKYDDPSDDPKFYARTMVVNVPYGESSSDFLMFTNTVNSVSKIKWEIAEDKLIGRVAFERVPGTDGQGLTPKNPDPSQPLAQNDGLVVYEFKIDKQFDIRRDYNSQTGEETNVVVENDTDRPWVQRDYIRVDFSKNNVTTAYDFDTLSLLGMYNQIDYSPLEFYVADPNDKDAPVLDMDNGYFDVTNKVFANPKMIDLGDDFKIPYCMLPNFVIGGTSPTGNCNPNEITLRHSFRRVVDTDYEPIDWDGYHFEAYGAFTTDRYGYARDYGLADANWHRFISRYNIWERSHAYQDPTNMTGPTQCLTDAECQDVVTENAPVRGVSHCDKFAQKCTLPFADRKVKPVYWHYSDGSPEMYYEATREATEEWDASIRQAVLTAKYAECKKFGLGNCPTVMTGNWADEENSLYLVKEINACKRGDIEGQDSSEDACNQLADALAKQRGYGPGVADVAKMSPVVYLCHSPVTDKDPAGCGKVGTIARLGDLRYHLITSVAKVETNSPWGIMSDANDPETGEKVSASVNIWTHVNDLFSRGLVDTMRYINGELKTSDITDGTYIDNWVQAAKQLNGGGVGGIAPLMGPDEQDKRIAAVSGTTIENLRAARQMLSQTSKYDVGGPVQKFRSALLDDLKKVYQTRASLDAPSVNAPLYAARLNALKGTQIEGEMVTPAMQQMGASAYGVVPTDSANITHAASIFQGMNRQLQRSLEQRWELGLAKRGSCIMQFEATAPLGYVALGNVLQNKFGNFNANDTPAAQAIRADKMKDYVRRRAQYAVISHEMGHSWGERHNFVSSSDPWNFRPQYWLLRTNAKKAQTGAVNKSCDSKANASIDPANCVGPRWADAVTKNESDNLIHMWAQSSTMEYPGEPSQDLMALGRYDFGAARMFYGETAAVYDDASMRKGVDGGDFAENHQDEFGGLLGYQWGGFNNAFHYSELDQRAGLIKSCSKVSNVNDFQPKTWNADKDGKWHPMFDGHIVTDESGTPTRCSEPKLDFVRWSDLKDDQDLDGQNKYRAIDAKNRVRVPHGFASDDWADLGNIAVYRHDNGADIYEQMQFWQAQQEITHIFTNYRRNRTDFSIWGAFNRTLSRYHEKMRDSAKAMGLYITIARDTSSEYNSGGDPQAFVGTILGQVAGPNVLASSVAFDHFAHVFARPEPGDHGIVGQGDTVLRSLTSVGFVSTDRISPVLAVPNGVTGGYGTISLGGRPIENALASTRGRDYDRDYTLNVGDYYEKAYTAMLFAESADNFISAQRDDFVDPRFRAVSIADVFPDGFRRWLGNNLTGDDAIKGVYVRGTGGSTTNPQPQLDPNNFATLGFTQWWPTAGINTCFPDGERVVCDDPLAQKSTPGTGGGPVVDPQIGWEQQKFAMIFAEVYIRENSRMNWSDQMKIYKLGTDPDPGFDNRIEFHSPDGSIYIARTYGKETLYGKVVQKGIAARMLQYANEILAKGVKTVPVQNAAKTETWNVPVIDPATGTYTYLRPDGSTAPTCEQSQYCTKTMNYQSVPQLLRQVNFGLEASWLKGVY